ncbi:MAG: hypothetical protein JNN13_11670 [Planctomycetes bacterium]|nr:hypothetical protein [Planctomycetota bacterium]
MTTRRSSAAARTRSLALCLYLAAWFGAAPAPAQSTAVVPSICAALPGNAAVSLPLRWSHGIMQVWIEASLLPTGFVGQTISGVRLRRSTLPFDTAYGPVQRTLTVRGAFWNIQAVQMTTSLTQNRPPALIDLFGPAPVAVAATAAPGAATVLGEEFLHVQFTTPLPVVAGTLCLEFETSDAPLQVSSEHWVDAVWMEDGVDEGYVAFVGDGSCTTQAVPTRLAWVGSAGPDVGTTTALQASGIPANGLVLAWVGLDPTTRPPGAGYLGFGGDFGFVEPALAGCHQWAPFDATWFGAADANGRFAVGLAVPATAALGTRLGFQVAWLDPARSGFLPFSFSNGAVLAVGSAAIGSRCATAFFPAGVTTSPWSAFRGQMPVLMLEH